MMWKMARHKAMLIEGERSAVLSLAQGRVTVLAICFSVLYLLLMVRILDLGVVQGKVTHMPLSPMVVSQMSTQSSVLTLRRGDVYDRNGFLIATTLKTPSLFVDPALVLEPKELLEDLVRVFPDLEKNKILRLMGGENRFGWVRRNITPEQQKQVLEIGAPGLGFEYEYRRVYPQGDLFAHLLGYTDRDGVGLSGIERGMDSVLRGGGDVHVSIDLRLQHLVKREVGRAMSEFTAKAGVGIVLDVKTGEILAGVSLPDFDLNLASRAGANKKFNRMSLGVYELGSMFKIFSTAALLDIHDVGMGKTFDARKPLRIGRYTINDYHAQKRIMSVPEVFMHSSNIGSAMMGQMVGGKDLRNFYSDLGLLKPMELEIKEVGRPIVPAVPWRESTTLTASYGHGLATTPLQMSVAVATIINDGLLVHPTFISQKASNYPPDIKSDVRIISEKTSLDMRKLLRLTVAEGTGKNADVLGFSVGGKTGTAEKSVNGRYVKKLLISSFVGAFPMDDPKYVIMVMVDEPNGTKDSYGYATAGWVAAPAAKRIVKSMVSVMGISPKLQNNEEDLSATLRPYIYDKKNGGKKVASY